MVLGSVLTIIDLPERDKRIFARDQLFDVGGQSLILPETQALSAVEIREVAAGTELQTRGLIGYLPLTSRIVLNLQPKFSLNNLWAMLVVADETYERVLPVLRSYEATSTVAPHQLLARGFCYYLRKILDEGVTRGYYAEPRQGYFQPKMHFGRTVARFLSRGDDINVASDTFAFSNNLPVNSLLKAACIDFLRVMPRDAKWQADRKLVAEALNALHRLSPMPMRFGDEGIVSTVPMWVREQYLGALTVYAILMGFSHVGFSYEAQGSVMPSFLFKLDDIFESYVRNVLRAGLREARVSVLDGNLPRHQKRLFHDNRQFPIKPDTIMCRGHDILAIGEVKYKPKIEEEDRYQVISHVVASGASIGIWISPAPSPQKAGLNYVGAMPTGAKFYHYLLDISGDLKAVSAAMVENVLTLIRSDPRYSP